MHICFFFLFFSLKGRLSSIKKKNVSLHGTKIHRRVKKNASNTKLECFRGKNSYISLLHHSTFVSILRVKKRLCKSSISRDIDDVRARNTMHKYGARYFSKKALKNLEEGIETRYDSNERQIPVGRIFRSSNLSFENVIKVRWNASPRFVADVCNNASQLNQRVLKKFVKFVRQFSPNKNRLQKSFYESKSRQCVKEKTSNAVIYPPPFLPFL